MSMPAGWYDDGSGRQRWWDGAQWTEHYAPGQGGPISAQPQPTYAATTPVTPDLAAGARVAPVLGLVGLGLAVLGTILACIPAVFGVGVVVLLAAFVVSLIGLFKKNAAKWPSITGMILSVVGGIIGTVVLVIVLAANLASTVDPTLPADTPSSTTEQPSDAPTAGTSDERLSPGEIAEGFAALAQSEGLTTYDDMPDFYPCFGQFLYDSEVSDESLRLITAGGDPLESERDVAGQAIIDATLTCDPQP